jgi:diaminohydroxyphosphoribosylaminopyrimidine deaminase/5-amino-6-(5-phosphoribosylamino)uracil reductase
LRAAGVAVASGVGADVIGDQLAPYLIHRTTGRPRVVLKLAASLDARTAAPDGTSRWITGEAARADAHRLRAESDAILVGAGTVRADDPDLTVRHVHGRDPLRVVLGRAPEGARVHPCLELQGDLGEILDDLGARDVLQVLVEGGASVAGAFHRAGFVDSYAIYLAPALFGGDDAPGLFSGAGAATMSDVWRGCITRVTPLGDDIRVDLRPARST